MSLPNEWGQAPFVPQGHSSEGGPGPPGEGYPPLMGDGGTRAARLPQHMVPFLKAEGGGGQRLGPATAGLSVKGLPMTENFLSQSSYRRQERQRQDGAQKARIGTCLSAGVGALTPAVALTGFLSYLALLSFSHS